MGGCLPHLRTGPTLGSNFLPSPRIQGFAKHAALLREESDSGHLRVGMNQGARIECGGPHPGAWASPSRKSMCWSPSLGERAILPKYTPDQPMGPSNYRRLHSRIPDLSGRFHECDHAMLKSEPCARGLGSSSATFPHWPRQVTWASVPISVPGPGALSQPSPFLSWLSPGGPGHKSPFPGE